MAELPPADLPQEGVLVCSRLDSAECGNDLARPDLPEMQMGGQPACALLARRVPVRRVFSGAVTQKIFEPSPGAFFPGAPRLPKTCRPVWIMASQVPCIERFGRWPASGGNQGWFFSLRERKSLFEAPPPEWREDPVGRTAPCLNGPGFEEQRGIERSYPDARRFALRPDIRVLPNDFRIVKPAPYDCRCAGFLRQCDDGFPGSPSAQGEAAAQFLQVAVQGVEAAV